MSTNNLFDNTMKVYLNVDGSIERVVDSSFFVANSSEVNILQLIVQKEMNVNKANVSFKRSDGNVISNRVMLYKGIDLENETLKTYEYIFSNDDRVLTVGGNLEISFRVEYIDANNKKVYATPIVSSYIRKNIDTNPDIETAEAVYQEIDQLTENLQASVNSANVNINEMQIDILDLRGDIAGLETVDADIYNKIETLQERDNALSERITDEKQELEKEIDTKISQTKQELESNIVENINQIDNKKLNKIFDDIAIANNLADNDYFVLNSGNSVYRINFKSLKDIILENVESGGVNHYKGDFLTYEALVEEVPIAQPGDYAFVNVGTEMIMYVWDVDGADETHSGIWRETTSGKYVLTTTFSNFQQRLLNGGFIVDTAKKYDNGNGTKTNIKTKFNQIENDIMDVVTNVINPLNTKIESLEEDSIKIIDFGVMTSQNITITQNQWDEIVNNNNVILKASLVLSENTYELIAERNFNYYYNNSINAISFDAIGPYSEKYIIRVSSNLTAQVVGPLTYAIPTTLDVSLSDTTLTVGISDGDTATYKSADLTPAIQQVINSDDNAMYVFEINTGTIYNKEKMIELLKNGKEKNIAIYNKNNGIYVNGIMIQNTTTLKKWKYTNFNRLSTMGNHFTASSIIITIDNKGTLNYSNSQENILDTATDSDISTGTSNNTVVTPKSLKYGLSPINTSIEEINTNLNNMNTRITNLENSGGSNSWELVGSGIIDASYQDEEGFHSFGENEDFEVTEKSEWYVWFKMIDSEISNNGIGLIYTTDIFFLPITTDMFGANIQFSFGGIHKVGSTVNGPVEFGVIVDLYAALRFKIVDYNVTSFGNLEYKIYAR